MSAVGLFLIVAMIAVLVAVHERNKNPEATHIPWEAAGAFIAVLTGIGTALITLDHAGDANALPEPRPTVTVTATVTETARPPDTPTATPTRVQVVWDQPLDGAAVKNCLELSGHVPGGLPPDQTIVLGDRGETSDHWSFRYGDVHLSADRTTWKTNWTLGSLTNRTPNDYDLVAIVMPDEQAKLLVASQPSTDENSWQSTDIPERAKFGILATAQITVSREFSRPKC
jgi:hypothetical protein